MTNVAPLGAADAKKHGKVKKYSGFPNRLALPASHGVDDEIMLSIPVSPYFSAMVPCVVYYNVSDLPYAFLVLRKLLWSTERCLKCFLDVLNCNCVMSSFVPSFACC